VSLTIDPRGGRVSGVSKGTIEESRASEQIGWVDHEGARWIRSRSYRWLKC
jgi:hypothetical protein